MPHVLSVTMLAALMAIPLPARSYQLRLNKDGKVLVWSESPVQLVVDESSIAGLAGAGDAVRAAFAAWSAAGVPVRVELEEAHERQPGRRNVVRWEPTTWPYDRHVVAMTSSMYRRSSATITRSDIILNAVHHRWTTTPATHPERFDVQAVATHEAGHFFGLGHTSDAEATMFADTPAGESKKRSLEVDDRQAIAALIAEMDRRRQAGAFAGPEPTDTAGPLALDLPQRAGCQIGAAAAPGALPLALLLAAVLARRRRTLLSLGVVLGILTGSARTEATVVEALTVEQLAQRADVILEGQVIASHSRWDGPRIVSEHIVAVRRCLKGPCTARVHVRTLGGEVGDHGMHFDGAPRLRPTEQVVLFGRRHEGICAPLGLAQGLFHIAGALAVRDLSGLHLVARSPDAATGPDHAPVDLPLAQLRAIVRSAALRPGEPASTRAPAAPQN